eukprot:TRINITY_DN3712_c0_g1_i1.p5 TRINITY_DN3712_c0_g1~~TRINITY_DN3712_c0_g1_i1.p5  ORF type:complete len:124 (-),score=16.50 TRINITY_DN3712_c0_g1_i1:204-575(-)
MFDDGSQRIEHPVERLLFIAQLAVALPHQPRTSALEGVDLVTFASGLGSQKQKKKRNKKEKGQEGSEKGKIKRKKKKKKKKKQNRKGLRRERKWQDKKEKKRKKVNGKTGPFRGRITNQQRKQ